MPLIKCPECGNQVSTLASTCPQCGVPINNEDSTTSSLTIQETSKQLKVYIIYSSLIFWFGLILLIWSLLREKSFVIGLSVFFLLIGCILFLITKLRIWWHHK